MGILHLKTCNAYTNMNYRISILCLLLAIMATGDIWAQKGSTNDTTNVTKRGNRLTVGGYGEATFKHNFFSDNAFRYSYANRYAQSSGHSQVDLPHVVLWCQLLVGRHAQLCLILGQPQNGHSICADWPAKKNPLCSAIEQ